ncbi:MAG: nucleoside recognition domain-containing protein [Lachnospiraceae bacterium]
MMNWLWAGMILLGILWGMFHGTLDAVTEGIIQSSKDAVTLCITMLGIMSFWTGILEIGSRAGIIEAMVKRMKPIMKFLFPKLPLDHPAAKSIAVNMIANMLGMGWAATPAGLKAMGELEELEEDRRKSLQMSSVPKGTASNEMCIFLIINISSLQLIPVNMLAYRAQYGSADPAAIVGPALAATAVSTLAAVVFCRMVRDK